jgi:UrcA family protein
MNKTCATRLTILTFATLFGSVAVAAEEGRVLFPSSMETISVKVLIDDVDPGTERGARAVYRRIATAANRICSAEVKRRRGVHGQVERHRAARCFDAAVDEAVAEVREIAGVDVEQLAKLDRQAEERLTATR